MYSTGSQTICSLLVKLFLYGAFAFVLYNIDKYSGKHFFGYFIPAIFVYFYFTYHYSVQDAIYQNIVTPYTTQLYKEYLKYENNGSLVLDIGMGNAMALLGNAQ